MNTSELYYQTGRDYLIHQESVHKQFSDRAISLIGFGIAMIAAGVIALNFGPEDISYDSGFFHNIGDMVVNVLSSRGALHPSLITPKLDARHID